MLFSTSTFHAIVPLHKTVGRCASKKSYLIKNYRVALAVLSVDIAPELNAFFKTELPRKTHTRSSLILKAASQHEHGLKIKRQSSVK